MKSAAPVPSKVNLTEVIHEKTAEADDDEVMEVFMQDLKEKHSAWPVLPPKGSAKEKSLNDNAEVMPERWWPHIAGPVKAIGECGRVLP